MERYNPVTTYRIQFNSRFSLTDVNDVLGYLRKLGIRTIYASPVFNAVRGSTHGYDVTDPLSVNPEIGGEDAFRRTIRQIRRRGMGWLQDFVPNHMAFSPENPWIRDLLLKGEDSPWYETFDIFANHPDDELRGKLMLPFFGKGAEELVRDGELELRMDNTGLMLGYYENEYPVSLDAYGFILDQGTGGTAPAGIKKIRAAGWPDSSKEGQEKLLPALCKNDPPSRNYVDRCLERINGDPRKMESLLERLSYLPVHWKETERRINYRRFFTINGLICVNIQNSRVFEKHHQLVGEWMREGVVDGLRIDHIDGLYDPEGYLAQLRELAGSKPYIAVEKILEKGERIPGNWPVEGTTGYDFLAMVNNLLTNSRNGSFFHEYYQRWAGTGTNPDEIFLDKKRFILYHRLRGELDILTRDCLDAARMKGRQAEPRDLETAIGEFMVHCPVYKYYLVPSRFTPGEKRSIRKIFAQAKASGKAKKEMLQLLEQMILPLSPAPGDQTDRIDRLFRRIMQFTGPLMAKGLEDTAWYSFNPFIAHNEVGDSPGYFGIGTGKFHRLMAERRKRHPMTMNALSTHDTKRGEDARARLNVISDLPGLWKSMTGSWREINRPLKENSHGREAPVPADEYLLYQALCAHIPMDGSPDETFLSRLDEYLVKALREAKERSSWSDPDEFYEAQVIRFTRRILDPEHAFRKSLSRFLERITRHGIINSLTQLVLKNTAPGIPDTFQGNETWNLSFVDPDNRQPVDYSKLAKDLDYMIRQGKKDRQSLVGKLWKDPANGKIKQWVTCVTLQLRTELPDLFLKGRYTPLKIKGKLKKQILAFHRADREDHLLVVVPLHTAELEEEPDWQDVRIKIPDLLPLNWEHVITGEMLALQGTVPAAELFGVVPFAVLRGIPNTPERRAGILMHVTSLPGDYGCGDFGRGAREFARFLKNSGQKYWQVLPLGVTENRTGFSPYSSPSAFAGNPMLVDPGRLVEEGLLRGGSPEKYKIPAGARADFHHAGQAKSRMLDEAYTRWTSGRSSIPAEAYESFLDRESYWIHDYALFKSLKQEFRGDPWFHWPAPYRDRKPGALEEFRNAHPGKLQRIMFAQFLFSRQWQDLKALVNDLGVEVFGDVPIYADHDSADVWAHRKQFLLSPDGTMASRAGVPPDYFNEDGQLWGMPLYDWKAMEANGFEWWLQRIGRNLAWFDLLRMDHFRGFSAYWEVPGDADRASEGRWREGPGHTFFDAVRRRFPGMPFVAEDLGQIDQAVYDLRDRYGLPGMKVVQFGFGPDMPFSHHNPSGITYHSVTYTGTHDNNTMKGWFRKEADKKTLKRYRSYTGKTLKKDNVHTEMTRLAYASPSRLVIIPMQDWLGLDETSRMNFPSSTRGNWLWRMEEHALRKKLAKKIRKKVLLFGRY